MNGPTGSAPAPGYWPSPWSCEDGGPARRQVAAPGWGGAGGLVRAGGLASGGLASGEPGAGGPEDGGPPHLEVTSRVAVASTMVVTRDPGQVYLLRHTAGDDAVSFVERIDPRTLEPLGRSADLAGGPAWPGSIAAHADGSLIVVFGDHAHRLDADLSVEASAELPVRAPYNGFVILPDGTVVTKNSAASRPGHPVAAADRQPCELVALDPANLATIDRCTLPEASIARLSADGDTVYVVGDTSFFAVPWDGAFRPDRGIRAAYRTAEGQTYGWDAVITGSTAWFLDDGEGSDAYDGTLRGHGVSTAPLHLVRVDLDSGAVTTIEVSGLAGGLIANPPLVDPHRGVAVGFDSGNGVMAAFDIGVGAPAGAPITPRWTRAQDHAPHMVLLPGSGEIVTCDFARDRGAEQVVVLDLETGDELARADTGSPVQSVLFPAVGFDRDIYLCTFASVSRVTAAGR
ncbi:MAG: hypothetical protein M0007_04890 [Actinomycetota bacterium]|nr:hypothetical protein [Actinomycetota bacterium]